MPATFNEWIMQAKVTDNPVGDFIDDTQMLIRVGRPPPPVITSEEQLKRFLLVRNACPQAMDTIPAVWRRYQRWLNK
jgi:hypothetical protein